MKLKSIDKILSSNYFTDKPPVLIDIGASGEVNPKWRDIAQYCICLCFDADNREFNISENFSASYKKLVKINRIVTSTKFESTTDFYLTKSPYCSSTLMPDMEALKSWAFNSLFEVEEVVKLNSITIADSLAQAKIDYIDWFKTDTQGTDLRLYLSLPDKIKQNCLICEFEPGIIDAYQGEDKLYDVMNAMHQEGYWLSNIVVKGTQRVSLETSEQFFAKTDNLKIPINPCWAELTYFRNVQQFDKRDLLLLLVFSIIEKQYGFSLELCNYAISKFDDLLFRETKNELLRFLNKRKYGTLLSLKIKNILSRLANKI